MKKQNRAQYCLIFSLAVILAAMVLMLTGIAAIPNITVSGAPLSATLYTMLAVAVCLFAYVALRYDIVLGIAAFTQYAHDALLTLALVCVYSTFAKVGAWLPGALLAGSMFSVLAAIYMTVSLNAQKKQTLLATRPRAEVAAIALKNARHGMLYRAAVIVVVMCALGLAIGPVTLRDYIKVIVIGLVVTLYSTGMITGYVWSMLEEKRLARKPVKAKK